MENKESFWNKTTASISSVIAALGIIGGIIYIGEYKGNLESRIFPDYQKLSKTIEHIENGLTPAQEQRAFLMDSMNKKHAMESRSLRDSIMGVTLRLIKHTDSINTLNADQMYQIKEQLKIKE